MEKTTINMKMKVSKDIEKKWGPELPMGSALVSGLHASEVTATASVVGVSKSWNNHGCGCVDNNENKYDDNDHSDDNDNYTDIDYNDEINHTGIYNDFNNDAVDGLGNGYLGQGQIDESDGEIDFRIEQIDDFLRS